MAVLHKTLLETPPQQQDLMNLHMSSTGPTQRPLNTSSGVWNFEKGEPLPLMGIHTAARQHQKQPLLNGPTLKGPTPLMNLQAGSSQKKPLMEAPPPLMNLQVDRATQRSDQFQPLMNLGPHPLMNVQVEQTGSLHLQPLMPTRPAPLLSTPPPKIPLMERPAPLLSTPSQQQSPERSMHQAPLLSQQPSKMDVGSPHQVPLLDAGSTHHALFQDAPTHVHQCPLMNWPPQQRPLMDELPWQPALLRTPPQPQLSMNGPPMVALNQPPVVPLLKAPLQQQPLPNLHIENTTPFQEPLYMNGPPPKRPLIETTPRQQPLRKEQSRRRRT